MALDPTILRKIRYEIGLSAETTTGVDDDDTLEEIFNDSDEGNGSILVTALIVWRHRLADYTNHAFDMTTEGSLLSRSQKIRFMERRIKELSLLVDGTATGLNAVVVGPGAGSDDDGIGGTEFS
jgi:hypothetical protein